MSLKPIIRTALLALALAGLAVHVASPGSAAGPWGAAAAPPSPSPAPAATPAPGKDPLLEFVPREHVPADSAVSFPVDI